MSHQYPCIRISQGKCLCARNCAIELLWEELISSDQQTPHMRFTSCILNTCQLPPVEPGTDQGQRLPIPGRAWVPMAASLAACGNEGAHSPGHRSRPEELLWGSRRWPLGAWQGPWAVQTQRPARAGRTPLHLALQGGASSVVTGTLSLFRKRS